MKKRMVNRYFLFMLFILFFFVGCDTALSINHPPVITSEPIIVASENVPYLYDVEGSDSDGDLLTYTLTLSPIGMSINPFTGLITWNYDPNHKTNSPVFVEVTDEVHTVGQNLSLSNILNNYDKSTLIKGW